MRINYSALCRNLKWQTTPAVVNMASFMTRHQARGRPFFIHKRRDEIHIIITLTTSLSANRKIFNIVISRQSSSPRTINNECSDVWGQFNLLLMTRRAEMCHHFLWLNKFVLVYSSSSKALMLVPQHSIYNCEYFIYIEFQFSESVSKMCIACRWLYPCGIFIRRSLLRRARAHPFSIFSLDEESATPLYKIRVQFTFGENKWIEQNASSTRTKRHRKESSRHYMIN